MYLVDEAVAQMKRDGPEAAQTMLCVFDLRGFTMANADVEFLRSFLDLVFKYFPRRISQVGRCKLTLA